MAVDLTALAALLDTAQRVESAATAWTQDPSLNPGAGPIADMQTEAADALSGIQAMKAGLTGLLLADLVAAEDYAAAAKAKIDAL